MRFICDYERILKHVMEITEPALLKRCEIRAAIYRAVLIIFSLLIRKYKVDEEN